MYRQFLAEYHNAQLYEITDRRAGTYPPSRYLWIKSWNKAEQFKKSRTPMICWAKEQGSGPRSPDL